jgi:hypothetical protein
MWCLNETCLLRIKSDFWFESKCEEDKSECICTDETQLEWYEVRETLVGKNGKQQDVNFALECALVLVIRTQCI